jgi:hypothetical protein
MATTYNLISSVTVGSGGASYVEFTSIPQTYTDLNIILSGRNTSSGDWFSMNFNGSTSTFTGRQIFADGAGIYSYSKTNADEHGVIPNSSTTASVFGNVNLYIPNYTSSNSKSFSVDSATENMAGTAYRVLGAGLWSTSSAITSIRLIISANNFAEFSSAELYGISNA